MVVIPHSYTTELTESTIKLYRTTEFRQYMYNKTTDLTKCIIKPLTHKMINKTTDLTKMCNKTTEFRKYTQKLLNSQNMQ